MSEIEFTPVVIIGAGRSGTNALRDMLTALPGFATWNCDEINPIWRHGNVTWPDDEIPADRATPTVRRFIRRAFTRIWRRSGRPEFIVEKTCANALRVPFVDAILPEAKYIHIVRSGIDVVASARKRWQGDLEMPGLPYFAAKARYTPMSDLPRYAFRFLSSRAGMALGHSKRLSVWGPHFREMDRIDDHSLEEICALQWATCVSRADAALAEMEKSRVLTIRYEDMASNPRLVLDNILDFLGVDLPEDAFARATANIRNGSVGKGAARLRDLSETTIEHMRAPLAAHGYDLNAGR